MLPSCQGLGSSSAMKSYMSKQSHRAIPTRGKSVLGLGQVMEPLSLNVPMCKMGRCGFER